MLSRGEKFHLEISYLIRGTKNPAFPILTHMNIDCSWNSFLSCDFSFVFKLDEPSNISFHSYSITLFQIKKMLNIGGVIQNSIGEKNTLYIRKNKLNVYYKVKENELIIEFYLTPADGFYPWSWQSEISHWTTAKPTM